MNVSPSLTLLLTVREVSAWLDLSYVAFVMLWLACCWRCFAHCTWTCWLGVSGIRQSGTSRVETVGLSWTTPLGTVPIHRSPFWLVIFGVRTGRSGTARVKIVGLSWTTPLATAQNRPLFLSGWSRQDLLSFHLTYWVYAGARQSSAWGWVHWV